MGFSKQERTAWLGMVAATGLAHAQPVLATEVSLSGIVVNACILTTTPGTLGPEGDGLTLSSAGVGGVPAILNVVATGGSPSLLFSAPTVTTPVGFQGNASPSIAYTSGGGVLQPFTDTSSTRALGRLIDVVTVQGRIVTTEGLTSGAYTVRTTVTCQQ